MNGLGATILCLLMLLILFASKRWALMGMIAGILYLPHAQHLDVAGFNLYAFRFLELAGLFRVLIRRENAFSRLNKIDHFFVLFYAYTVSVFLLRSTTGQSYQIGVLVDALLSYFVFRALIENLETFQWFLRMFLILLLPFAVIVLMETLTTHNLFASMGGVQLIHSGDLWFRAGRLRAIGSFGHPSLMGSVGGTFLPLYLGVLLSKDHRVSASIGIGLCLAIVWASNSGGPVACVIAALVGWMLWPMRMSMQWFRRGFVAMLILLALVMKAPIWYLPAKFSNLIGGDGYHRSALLDVAFRNLGEWWLAGMEPLGTSHWLPYTNTLTGAVDMTNAFLGFGITAGLGSVVLLVAVLTQAFKHIGTTLATLRTSGHTTKRAQYLYWALGVLLAVHVNNWFAISYWDQFNLIWFMHLAAVSSLGDIVLRPQRESMPIAEQVHARLSHA